MIKHLRNPKFKAGFFFYHPLDIIIYFLWKIVFQ